MTALPSWASCPLASLRLLLALSAFALIPLALAAPARAQEVVTSTADDGTPGTLRYEIQNAAPGDTITFDPSVTGTITLTMSELLLSQSLTIQGPGAANLAVDGAGSDRVFGITGGTVVISGLTIQNGGPTR